MTSYCLVQDGVVVLGPRSLPEDYAGIINFNLYPTPEDYGWLPVVVGDIPACDPTTEKVTSSLTVVDGQVHQTFSKSGMTRAERDVIDPVPMHVSAAQAIIVINEYGLLDALDAAIAALPRYVQIWYNRANNWDRGNAYVQAMAIELGLTDDQIDDMFRLAAKRS
jgi:hypothetical protein